MQGLDHTLAILPEPAGGVFQPLHVAGRDDDGKCLAR